MKPILMIAGLVFALAACSGSTATPAPAAPTEDPALVSCRQDVQHANLNVHDVTALDFAIHDCPSLEALKAAVAAAPGYLNADVTVDMFVSNRCDDPKAAFAGLDNPICKAVVQLQ